MKRLFIFGCILFGALLLVPGLRKTVTGFAGEVLEEVCSFDFDRVRSIAGDRKPSSQPEPRDRTWELADGRRMEAVLVAADAAAAQLRFPQTQTVQNLKLEVFAEGERQQIQDWVQEKGQGGVAGSPIRLKKHAWPRQWRGKEGVALRQVPDTNLWKSQHFDITNTAGVKRDALESIACICESVDGALNALPLPLPLNWGRPEEGRRKVVIESIPPASKAGARAGYWDGSTGIVHINVEHLFEPDLQLVVFEFNKQQKRQKYDSIVHEVTHQSMAALIYLGVPAWVTEGIAEYMSAMQHSPSQYHFDNSYISVRYHINKLLLGDRIVKDRKMHLTHLENMMNRDLRQWNKVNASDDFAGGLQYDEALLLIEYFFHADHRNGLFFRRYLEAILSGAPEEEARATHLLRGRSYSELEDALIKRWKTIGFTINFQARGEIRKGDATVDREAEDIKRTMASRRVLPSG